MFAIVRLRLWLALAVAALLAGLAAPALGQTTTSPLDDEEFDYVLRTTNFLIRIDNEGNWRGSCSGTTISPQGHILTNFHCVGEVETGELTHSEGLVYVAPTKDEVSIPVPTYLAKVVASDHTEDIAVLAIVGMIEEGRPLPARLPVTPIEIGDSTKVKVRDFVGGFGYPGVGGENLTYNEGHISGFVDFMEDGTIDFMKTTMKVDAGNSGGTAVDADGRLIGIPTMINYRVENGDRFSMLLMVHRTFPEIEQALGAQGRPAPAPAPAPTGTIGLAGRIVDADTGRGIPDAVMVVLNPGVTWEEFLSSDLSPDLVTLALSTDRTGSYRDVRGIPRGQVYTVIVAAKGYEGRVFEDGLDVTNETAKIFEIEDIALSKQ